MTHKALMKVTYTVLKQEPLGLELDVEVMAALVADVAALVAAQERPHPRRDIIRAVGSVLWHEHHGHGRRYVAHRAPPAQDRP